MGGVGQTNLKIKTSNGLSPHMFPEYINEWNYFYAAAPRPGFMSRFIIGDNALRAPYWPTSPNSFGGQIGASANGDLPGDIYRLIGGIVMRKAGEGPRYAGYLERISAPQGHEQQPDRRRGGGGRHRPNRGTGPFLPGRPPAGDGL
jgi:hypothetical protein